MGTARGGSRKSFLMRRLGEPQAFTLVEIIVVILLIGILVTMVLPVYASVEDMAERGVCWHDQRSIQGVLARWYADHPDEDFVTEKCLPGDGEAYIDLNGNVPGDGERSLAEYFEEGSSAFDCPSNGTGVGQVGGSYDYITDGKVIACLTDNRIALRADGTEFKHDPAQGVDWNHSRDADESGDESDSDDDSGDMDEKKTPLGDTLEEISAGMIDLIMQYYEENGRWPNKKGDMAYTDIGLDPDDWEQPVDHIYYTPAGSQVKLTPESGYSFEVVDMKGKTRTISSQRSDAIIYDAKKGKWYYKNTGASNEIDIDTLKVVEE